MGRKASSVTFCQSAKGRGSRTSRLFIDANLMLFLSTLHSFDAPNLPASLDFPRLAPVLQAARAIGAAVLPIDRPQSAGSSAWTDGVGATQRLDLP